MNAITKRLQGSDAYTFWHHIESFWLVTSENPDVTATSLAEWMEQASGISVLMYVMLRVDRGSTEYWGRNRQAAWDWFESKWKRP